MRIRRRASNVSAIAARSEASSKPAGSALWSRRPTPRRVTAVPMNSAFLDQDWRTVDYPTTGSGYASTLVLLVGVAVLSGNREELVVLVPGFGTPVAIVIATHGIPSR